MTIDEEKIENVSPLMYVVVSGEYSDYSIVSVWSSKEAALTECKRAAGSDLRVEEYFLNTPQSDGARRQLRGYFAWVRTLSEEIAAGDVQVKNMTFFGEDEDKASAFEANRKGEVMVAAYSMSKENAVKLVLEKFADFRDEGQGSSSPEGS